VFANAIIASIPCSNRRASASALALAACVVPTVAVPVCAFVIADSFSI
jgi:hypothetical protein